MSTTFRELLRRSDPTGVFLFGDRTAEEIEKEVHYMASRRQVQNRSGGTPKNFKGARKRSATPQPQASGGGGAPPKKKSKRVRNRKDKKGKKKGGGTGAKENKTPNTPKQPPPSSQ